MWLYYHTTYPHVIPSMVNGKSTVPFGNICIKSFLVVELLKPVTKSCVRLILSNFKSLIGNDKRLGWAEIVLPANRRPDIDFLAASAVSASTYWRNTKLDRWIYIELTNFKKKLVNNKWNCKLFDDHHIFIYGGQIQMLADRNKSTGYTRPEFCSLTLF